jgi:hypothetical protein
MKQYLHAFAMCQSMFCAIPAPQLWDEEAKGKMLLFLPVAGLEIGALWAVLAWLCGLLHLPALITALVLSAWPFLASGFLHLDGFMDVTDAVKEYEKHGVIVCDRSNRSMYAKRIVEALGLTGAIRVSPMHCHSTADIDRFLTITAQIVKA